MTISRNEYRQLANVVHRFGKGLGIIFNTRRREDFEAFTQAFNRAASRSDRFKLGTLAVLYGLSEHLPSGEGFTHRIKRQHVELVIPIAIKAFGQAAIAAAIAPEDRYYKMKLLCQRVGARNLANLIQSTLR